MRVVAKKAPKSARHATTILELHLDDTEALRLAAPARGGLPVGISGVIRDALSECLGSGHSATRIVHHDKGDPLR